MTAKIIINIINEYIDDIFILKAFFIAEKDNPTKIISMLYKRTSNIKNLINEQSFYLLNNAMALICLFYFPFYHNFL